MAKNKIVSKSNLRKTSEFKLEKLEQRVLFSADLPFVVPDAAIDQFSPVTSYQSAVVNQIDNAANLSQLDTAPEDAISFSNLVIIDQDVENHAAIKESIESRTDGQWIVHVLDNGGDPIGSITAILAGQTNLGALHLITHGEDGELSFSGQSIDTLSLLQRADEISTWNHALAQGADILVYGCDIAASDDGKAMIDSLAHLTGADVAASDDATGHLTDNADWELEYRIGSIDADSALSEAVQDTLVSTLGNYFVTTTNETGAGSLNQAIADANSNSDVSTITFQIGGEFIVTSSTMAISQTVIIDGTQVPGYAGTPLVHINGEIVTGFGFMFHANADDSILRGVAISGFTGNGVFVNGVDRVLFEDNYFGTNGTIDHGMNGNGIYLIDTNYTVIINNLFVENEEGIYLDNASNTSIINNVFRNQDISAVYIPTANSVDNSIFRNTFIQNQFTAIDLGSSGPTANDVGVGDADTGPNDLQNYPVVTTATTNESNDVSITYAVDSAVASDFRLEFYSTADIRNAEVYLGSVDITTDALGNASGTVSFVQNVAAGDSIVATATEILGPMMFGSTSELSTGFTLTLEANTPPVITTPAAQIIDENSTFVTTVTVSDPDPDTHTFSITGGADASLFSIGSTSGTLSFITAPDKESPTDRVYQVEVNAFDGTASTTQLLSVTVNDIDEFVMSNVIDQDLMDNEVSESAAIGDVVGITVFATDDDATDSVSYSLPQNAGGRFSVDANGVIRVASSLDAETNSSHQVMAQASSSGGFVRIAFFTITVLDTNEFALTAVTDTDTASNSVSEGASIGASVGITATATDQDVNDSVTFSLTDDAGGLFAIDPNSGVVTVAGGLDTETASSHSITVQALSSDGGSSTADFTVTVANVNEFSVTSPTDIDSAFNQIDEDASIGDAVGITISATDADAPDSVSYSLSNDAGGRFSIDAGGVIRVAGVLDADIPVSSSVTVRATSTDGSFDESNFSITVRDVDEFPLSAVTDSDATDNTINENTAIGSNVGITASATDADISDSVTFSLTDDAGGLFTIDSSTGIVTVAGLIDAEAASSHTITIQASSTRSGTTSADFVISITDANEFTVSTPVDQDANVNQVAENASIGDAVGLTILASDADVSDSVSYTLTDDASGLFNIDAGGVISVAAGLDAETATSHTVTVRATSTDGTFSENSFNITVLDINEFNVSSVSDLDPMSNSVNENSATGSYTGLQAFATDPDVSQDVSYSLSNDAGGLFTIDSATGVVRVSGTLDAETASSHLIAVVASTTSSASTDFFVINVVDVNEHAPSAPTDQDSSTDQVAENASIGETVGLTIYSNDLDVSDTISYVLTDDADGRFSIDAGGVIRVASVLDAETDNAHSVTVRAISTDGTFNESSFIIDVLDIDESPLSALTDSNGIINLVSENAIIGTTVGITASASDADRDDTVSYSLSNDAGGLFSIDSITGIISVAGGLDAETASNHTITVTANSTRSGTTSADFVIDVTDVNNSSVSTPVDQDIDPDQVEENAAIGTTVGLSITAVDTDITDSVSYTLTDNAAGRFTIDGSGIIRVASSLDAETDNQHTVIVRATSTDGSFAESSFDIDVLDIDEFALSVVTDTDATNNIVIENALIGSTVGIVASASDSDIDDSVSYSLSNDAGGLFDIDALTGVVTVASAIDAEAITSHTITVQASSTRSGTTSADFIITVSDTSESAVTAPVDQDSNADQVLESANVGDSVGITALASDADITDTISYMLTNDGGGRFTIDTNGVVRVASVLDAETAESHLISIQALSSDGSTATLNATISVIDVNEYSLSTISDTNVAINTIAENSPSGTDTGIQASATDLDVSDSVSYTLSNDAGGLFSIDSTTGIVSLIGGVDAEASQTHTITVQATSTNSGSTQTDFVIAVTDVNESPITAPIDIDSANNSVTEHTLTGTYVGIQASSTDNDLGDTVSYALTGGNGLFTIDAAGRILVSGDLDVDISDRHIVTVVAQSTDGSSMSATFEIDVTDTNDQMPVVTQSQVFSLNENLTGSILIGTINATDNDTVGNLNTWQIDSGNEQSLFQIDANTGDLYLSTGQSANFEAQSTYSLGVSVGDGVNRSAIEQVIVQILDVNESPTTEADFLNASEDTPLSVTISSNLIANDSDPEGSNLSIVNITQASHGTVQNNGNGEIIYTPVSNYYGADQFQYTVTDGDGNTAIGFVNINVIATNDIPEIVIASTITLNENNETINANIQATDVEGDELSFTLAGVDAAQFTIDEQTGVIRFIEIPDFENPTDSDADNLYSIDVVVNDKQGASSSESMTIEVQNINDQHTVSANPIEITDNNTGFLGTIDVNDQDFGDTHTFTIIGGNVGNSLQIDDQGQIQQISALAPGIYFMDVSVRDQTGNEVVLGMEIIVSGDPDIELAAANPLTESSNNAIDFSTGSSPTTNQGQTLLPESMDSITSASDMDNGNDSSFQMQITGANNVSETPDAYSQSKSTIDIRSILNEIVSDINLIADASFSATPHIGNNSGGGSSVSESGGRQLVLELLLDSVGDKDLSLDALSASFDSAFADFNLSPQLLKALQSLNENFENQLEQTKQSKELIVNSVTVVTGTLSVGLITWLLNSGSLIATALTTSPLWRSIDPIPVLANRRKQDEL